jgi:hypothetical protein
VIKVMEVRHQVAIAGIVTDAATEKRLGGVTVKIVEMPAALERALAWKMKAARKGSKQNARLRDAYRTKTAPDGLFYFLDLPDGSYTIAVALEALGSRYGTAKGSAKVKRDAERNIALPFLEMALHATSVEGRVMAGKSGVTMAEIRVKGSDERTFSDAHGHYILRGIEPGKRVVLASARGCKQASKPITIEQPGDVATVNFALAPETSERASGTI